MSKVVKITSTLTYPIKLNYRMPRQSGETKSNPIITVALRDREWMLPVSFPTEAHFNEFKKQNEALINSKQIIFGEVKVKEAQSVSKENAAKAADAIKEKVDKGEDTLAELTDERVSIEVEKDEGPASRKGKK